MTFLLPDDVVQSAVSQFQAARAALAERWLDAKDHEAYLSGHADALDQAVRTLAQGAALPESIAISAVGGYGRRELFPFSDIDLLVILADDEAQDAELMSRVSGFFAALWALGLPVGACVRTRSEFVEQAQKDVSIATTYLEKRLIAGNAELFAAAAEDFTATLDARSFFRDKMLERTRRHQKHEDTPYSLEPNLKESPGGLRDLQTFLWCAKAAGMGESAKDMAAQGLLTAREARTIADSYRFLSQLRIGLHLIANRPENRLLFDVQEKLAETLGFKATGVMRASEALMKRYYLFAKSATQMSIILLQLIADKLLGGNDKATPVRLEKAFVARGDEMDIVDDDTFAQDPNAMLRAFVVFEEHPEVTRFSTRLLRRLWAASFSMGPAYRDNPANKATFLEILELHKADQALDRMNTWSILGRFLVPFRHIVGQMQHDLYHIFTVDQHTLRVVRNIRRFAASAYAHEYPFCSQVMAGIEKNWRLTAAGLFHDIGKGLGGRHEVVGAEKAAEFCRRFGLAQEDAELIVFLVREHLTMSRVAQKEDISDPNVAARFAKLVGTQERLDALYLLTVADIRATSPKVWTPWKGQLLETLYRAASEYLARPDAEATPAHALARRVDQARALAQKSVPPDVLDAFWKTLDLVYFMRHSATEIAWHAEVLAARRAESAPIVRVKAAPSMGGLIVLLYLPDKKGIFLRAVAALGRSGLSVVDARIHTTKSGWALDTFLVADAFGRFGEAAAQRAFEKKLADALASEAPIPAPAKARLSRRSRHFPTRPSVVITPDDSGHAHILNLVGTDRIGLLVAVSSVLAKYDVDLQTARIATLGERAEDVFLISGAALGDDAQVLKLEAELLDALAAPAV